VLLDPNLSQVELGEQNTLHIAGVLATRPVAVRRGTTSKRTGAIRCQIPADLGPADGLAALALDPTASCVASRVLSQGAGPLRDQRAGRPLSCALAGLALEV
jgi:hypothetical protein